MGEALRFIVIIGRALLQAFHSPFWGGALLSGMLTLISWLFGYVFRLRGRFGYLKYIPAFVFYLCGRLPRFRHLLSGGNR